ncbi:uncharacterized protein LACBIDRAFT_297787 [Laccaria bicolor S238N-H82]|uniref:Predicted protein n=1 Tax=Laccaria bicolor (strain S238N-H82 / ATCC MYA-4686) TaxID=486041 RepID=B0DAW1_LACBS|nr:uncharacterized protein LACBIDRAFT_297787 [Laccaria bicolor S238N-H82]EDR08277.1 predicted protein [Laccaria bicolor S238N-H82]|eukprot:XP_001881347.1 predicted protein [Laccaria bicolor S238N-H82]
MPKSVFSMMFARSLFGSHFLLYLSSHFLEDTEEAQRSIDGQPLYVSNANAERYFIRVS